MKLEYGKRYVTRGGDVTGPLRSLDSASHPYVAETESTGTESWTGDGRYFSSNVPSDLDLVSEYTDPQVGLTKREFIQRFIISRVGVREEYNIHAEINNANYAWKTLEEQFK